MRGISVICTYNCNIMCTSCTNKCGPHRKGIMRPEIFEYRVRCAYEQGFSDYILIRGGELFKHTGMLFKYLKRIDDLKCKRIAVTNGFWGDMDHYINIIYDLKERGVDEIRFEYDFFHSVYIKEQTLLEAIKKTVKAGLSASLEACFETEDISSKNDEATMKLVNDIRKEFRGIKVQYITVKKYDGLYSDSLNKNEIQILY